MQRIAFLLASTCSGLLASHAFERALCITLGFSTACASASSSDSERSGVTAGAGSGSFGNADASTPSGFDSPRATVPIAPARCTRDCDDFPAAPIFDASGPRMPPPNAPQLFGAPDDFDAPGPCVVEPALSEGDAPGALFPRNWLRPRFRWTPLPGEDLWEVRVTNEREANALVAYATRNTWEMPHEIWSALANTAFDTPVTVTVRGLATSAPARPSGTRGTFSIAPVEATGTLVYWATTSSEVGPETSKLVGFKAGEEGVVDALRVRDVGDRGVLAAGGRELRGTYDDPKGVPAGHAQCIGCHVSTPDGEAVAFTDHWPWDNLLASILEDEAGARPSYLTEGAELLLGQPWLGMQALSPAHFRDGDRTLLAVYSPRNAGSGDVGWSDGAPYPSRADRLAWFDLEASASFDAGAAQGDAQQARNAWAQEQLGTAFGLLTMDGETRSVTAPAWSHDGARIAYVSADVTQDGRLSGGNSEVDVRIVPYANRGGGTVEDLRGASEPGVAEYYPGFSADDALVAFNRVAPLDAAPMYYRPDGEIFVVPSTGGSATRLRANDPPACTNERSPGVINSWPKWSPRVVSVDPTQSEFGAARTFYWLVFSSARAYEGQFRLPPTQYSPPDTRSSQLYITALVRNDQTGELTTYPALYLWNQDPSTSNLTPAWDDLQIPDVLPPD